eukprot:scaffold4985_cov116-Isochrysis_galbana.AAC.1
MKPHSAVNEDKRRQAGETHGKKGLVFVLRELDPPLPPRKGDYRVGAQTVSNNKKPHVKQ